MKKIYMICGAVVLAACSCCLVTGVIAFWPRTSELKANFSRIEKGMTKAQVESVIGMPPSRSVPPPKIEPNFFVWFGDDGKAKVWFDDDGKAVEWEWTEYSESYEDTFRRLMGWGSRQ
jgi:hypothetical protein